MKNSWISIFFSLQCMMVLNIFTYSFFSHSFSTSQQTHERLRHFQMNGGPQQSFEETIHRVSFTFTLLAPSCAIKFKFLWFFFLLLQLKVQEAMRKKEKFQREHEEVRFTLITKNNWYCKPIQTHNSKERLLINIFSIKKSHFGRWRKKKTTRAKVIRNEENPLSITMEKITQKSLYLMVKFFSNLQHSDVRTIKMIGGEGETFFCFVFWDFCHNLVNFTIIISTLINVIWLQFY